MVRPRTRSTAEVFRAEVRIKHTRGFFRIMPASVAHGELNKCRVFAGRGCWPG